MELTIGSRIHVAFVVTKAEAPLPGDLSVRGLLANAGAYGLEMESASYEDPRKARRIETVDTKKPWRGKMEDGSKSAMALFGQ